MLRNPPFPHLALLRMDLEVALEIGAVRVEAAVDVVVVLCAFAARW